LPTARRSLRGLLRKARKAEGRCGKCKEGESIR
jgi:hypothetical protein